MYKIIKADGREFKIEYSIEASLYEDCADSVLKTIGAAESFDENAQIKAISSLPKTVLNMLHAGLLEHHGVEGDGSVTTIADTKAILKAYMKENNADFDSVANTLLEQMSDDGFFKLIGLDFQIESQPKEVKKPQDHKKKTTSAKQSES